MSGACCHHCDDAASLRQSRYRRLLWAALAINVAMFAVEIVSGLRSGSVSLLADSVDFLGDAANYGISLLVLGLSLTARARASRLKAVSMIVFGAWVLGVAGWHLHTGRVPGAPTMGAVGTAALLANGVVAALLLSYRDGDSNMRSVWLCTRNDVLGNIAVLLAALGVFGTRSAWPDLVVAAIMASLALTSAAHILRQSGAELRERTGGQQIAARS
ncbi:Co/Zn/Cd efflux system component [Paraburkholderia caballeronis]|uniref:cation transporter n=1 Tax=Paraburkholderia caballeronis TaxID=416943 RepID=UPI00106465DB|nr:cation transporter [Paraburkholderia caballeronis]TDV36157.1 Co/Zn/Cd efflux system component [Paraburkholderia caballeronis]